MPLWIPRSSASSGETSTNVSGVFSRMPSAAIGHVAFVEMLEQTAVVQMQIEFGVGLLGRLGPGEREQLRLAVGKVELLRVKQRLIDAVGGHRPLQRLVSFEPLVSHAGEQRRQRGDFVHDLRGVLIVPIGAEAVGDVLNDLPIGPAVLERLEHLIEPLNAPLGAGERAFFFQARARGQNHIGETGRCG